MPVPAHLIVGRVRRAHGIRGEVVVEALTDDGEVCFAVGRRLLAGTMTGELPPPDAPGDRELTIRRAAPFKGAWILRFAEIGDRSAAEQWRDRYLLVPAGEVAPPSADQIFYHDLIGMRVERPDGREVGRVAALYDLPQGVLLDIETPQGSTMLPYGPPMVVRVELERRTVIVDLPAGLLDDDER
jgi:16S rRNA processing protein RimM